MELNLRNMDLKQAIKTSATKSSKTINGLNIIKLKMNQSHGDWESKLQKYSLGLSNNSYPTKIIILMGETGTGKTTLINAMTNYILNVEFEDDFRFELINDTDGKAKINEAHSQTDFINCYEFNYMNGMPFEYNYVIIDTPGFGDTRGIERDRQTILQIEQLFKKDYYGVSFLDAVGIVTKSSSVRLTETQQYIFDELTGIFGVDIKDILYIMATHYDGSELKIEMCLKEANVPYAAIYEFNNSALYGNKENMFYPSFWKMGSKNMKEFFANFPKSKGVSLQLTKEVLETKQKLQDVLSGMPDTIQQGLDMVNEMEKQQDDLLKTDQELKKLLDTNIEMDKGYKTEEMVEKGVAALQKIGVLGSYLGSVPGHDGSIGVGVGVGAAVGLGIVIFKYNQAQKALRELKEKLHSSSSTKEEKKEALTKMEKEINELTASVLDSINRSKNYALQLQKISLKSGTISSMEYIETLIDRENTKKQPGYMKRIGYMEKIKKTDAMKEYMNNAETSAAHENVAFLKELDQDFNKMGITKEISLK